MMRNPTASTITTTATMVIQLNCMGFTLLRARDKGSCDVFYRINGAGVNNKRRRARYQQTRRYTKNRRACEAGDEHKALASAPGDYANTSWSPRERAKASANGSCRPFHGLMIIPPPDLGLTPESRFIGISACFAGSATFLCKAFKLG